MLIEFRSASTELRRSSFEGIVASAFPFVEELVSSWRPCEIPPYESHSLSRFTCRHGKASCKNAGALRSLPGATSNTRINLMNKLAIITIAFAFFLYPVSSTTLFRAAAQNAGAAQEPIQAGHTHDVIEVKWSPDDERLISYSGGDDYIRLWEVKSARLLWSARATFIQQKEEHYKLTNFTWSPEQSLIASGSGNGMIQMWDAQTGKLRWNVRAHAEYVNTLAFSQDGKYLVSSGLDEDEKNEIKTWSVVNGSQIRKFKADPGVVIAISVNRDGTRLKAGNLDG